MSVAGLEQIQTYGAHLQRAQLRGMNDFGLDPAIEADGPRAAAFDRRRVSLRWLSGSLLTGISGAGLIGAAIYAVLGHQTYFAELPSLAPSQRKEINLDFGVNPRKSDRLVKAVDISAGKQRFQAQMAIRIGEKEVVKVHSFTHIQTSLTLTGVGLSEEVPPYNPLKVLADARAPIDAAQELV